jgi:hypothetical protein
MDSNEIGKNSIRGLKRERLGSMDLYYSEGPPRKNTSRTAGDETPLPPEHNLSSPAMILDDGRERFLKDEFGLVALSERVEYFGPSRSTFEYSTYTPPTSWAEASRSIIPAKYMTKLGRRLKLDFLNGTLEIIEPTSGGKFDFSFPLIDISIFIHRPLEGGVLSIYVKGTPKEEWMEHTFVSAHSAAQFQYDLLAYQVLGTSLKHIFESLNIVHQGSLAYDGQEFVLHDNCRQSNDKSESERKPPKSLNATRCIAWDDAMRAMSSIPTVRIALERLWLSHRLPANFDRKQKKGKDRDITVAAEEKDVSDLDVLSEEYSGKRLLLGPLDLFRIFVPSLKDTAIPEGESNKERMGHLLNWRKRVARAAVLVRAYTRARRVANLGWNLSANSSGDAASDVKKRLAYDGNEENNLRDTASKNETYEASVSRDVLCYVRPFDFLSDDVDEDREDLVLSPYQAYCYVGSQYFKVAPGMLREGGALDPSRDPVDMFPSLKKIISDNSDLDFFITGTSEPATNAVVIHLYVRALAKGVDLAFDNVVSHLCVLVLCVCSLLDFAIPCFR